MNNVCAYPAVDPHYGQLYLVPFSQAVAYLLCRPCGAAYPQRIATGESDQTSSAAAAATRSAQPVGQTMKRTSNDDDNDTQNENKQ